MKTIFNIDKVRICLLQPEGFYDSLYQAFQNNPGKKIQYNGYHLSFAEKKDVNDKDITARLYLEDVKDTEVPWYQMKPLFRELGTFTFNKSQKYGSKCFFTFSTKSLYETAHIVYEGEGINTKYNYFTYPFFVFKELGLQFNNVSYLEIACDTEASVINRIRYAVGKPDLFDMVLLWKKVEDPNAILDGFWEYYQRSRVRKASRPSLYIHPAKSESGNNQSLKVYDKARELLQSRPDKEVLTRAWNGMDDKIQRMEISVENKQFKRFFNEMNARCPERWLYHDSSVIFPEQKQEEYRQALEHFFYDLGMNEDLRAEMFDYFSKHLLHFKLRNHDKTQVSILDLSVNSLAVLRRLGEKKTRKRNPKTNIGG